jgi:hypothetical protein
MRINMLEHLARCLAMLGGYSGSAPTRFPRLAALIDVDIDLNVTWILDPGVCSRKRVPSVRRM